MSQSTQFYTLSKSDYLAARECPTKLYYREMKYPSTNESDDYLKLLAVGGFMVEEIARQLHSGGTYVGSGRNPQENHAKTMVALENLSTTLFQATILAGRKQARFDILKRDGNVFDVIEVKAKSIDSVEHFQRIVDGEGNCFRGKKTPHRVNADWQKYIEDVAFQVMVLREQFPDAVIRPFLCLVDKSKRVSIDELPKYFRIALETGKDGMERVHRVYFDGDIEILRNDGLLVQLDVSSEVDEVMEIVHAESGRFEATLSDGLRKIPGVPRCTCADCEYRSRNKLSPDGFSECWGEMAHVSPSVLELHKASSVLGANGPLVNELLKQGKASLFDIPLDALVKRDGSVGPVATKQRLQINHTRDKTVWHSPELRESMERVTYPLHFIDFEACRLAIPPHARMKAYGLIAFQWSCHTQANPTARLVHSDWLNDEDYWPNVKFVRSLRDKIGNEGTILTWSPFEGAVLKDVLGEMSEFEDVEQDLRDWIRELTSSDRILDMHKLCVNGFFHPDMGGRTSIKVVLDALWKSDAGMRQRLEEISGVAGDVNLGPYAALPETQINGVRQVVIEGTGAIRAYQAMMYGVERREVALRQQWRDMLLQYCKLDTLAMVLIWEYWMRLRARAGV